MPDHLDALEPADPVPSPRTPGLTWRPATLDDVGALFGLMQRIQQHDEDPERPTEADVRQEMMLPWTDLQRDTLVGVDGEEELRAWGAVQHRPGAERSIKVSVPGGVDQEWRGRGVGRALLTWQLRRAYQHIAETRDSDPDLAALPGRVGTDAMEHQGDKVRLLEGAGLKPMRWWSEMQRPLDTLPDAPLRPADGLRLRAWSADLADAVRRAHNEAFRDHWGSEPVTEEAWRSGPLAREAFRPGLSFVAVAEGDEVAGYAVNAEYTQDWDEQGYSEGWTDLLGVRRAWRGRGVARLLLDASGRAFRDAGHDYAGLDVDSENPTGALQLYLGLGYHVTHGRVTYGADVPAH